MNSLQSELTTYLEKGAPTIEGMRSVWEKCASHGLFCEERLRDYLITLAYIRGHFTYAGHLIDFLDGTLPINEEKYPLVRNHSSLMANQIAVLVDILSKLS